MKIETSALLSVASSILFLVLLSASLFPQSAAEPLMMLPFAALSIYLVASNSLPRLQADAGLLAALLALSLTWVISGLTSAVPFPSKVTWIILGTLPIAYLGTRTFRNSPLPWLGLLAMPFALHNIWEGIHGINRPQTPFEDSNLLGLFYALAILSQIPFLIKSDKNLQKPASFLIALTLSTALIITESRSGLVCLLAGGASCFALTGLSSVAQLNLSRRAWLAIGLFVLTTITAITFTGFADRFSLFSDGVLDSSIAGRLAIWKASAAMALQHPFTGFGLGTFHLYYPQFRLEGDNSQGWMAHMDPLQSAIESGWISAVCLYLVFWRAATLIIRNRKTLSPLQVTAAAILTAFFLAMHLNYPLHSVPFLMIAGAALATLSFPDTEKKIPAALSWGLLVTLLSSLWILFQSTITLMLLTESKLAANLHDQSRFDRAISACLEDGDPLFPDCRVMAAKFLILAQNPDQERIIALLNQAEKGNPVSPEVPYQRALLERQQKQTSKDQILAYLQLSLTRNPAYWPARRLAIEIYVSRNEQSKAIKLLQDGMIYRYAPPTRNDIRRVSKELGIELK